MDETTRPSPAMADYSDGVTAARRRVQVSLTESTLELTDAETGAPVVSWPLEFVRYLAAPKDSQKPLRLTLADRSRSEADAQAAVTLPSDQRLVLLEDGPDPAAREMAAEIMRRAPNLARKPRAVGRLRRRLVYTLVGAIASIALVIFVLIPAAADQLATLIPPERERAMGEALVEAILDSESFFTADGDGPVVCAAPKGLAALEKMRARLAAVAGSHVPVTVRVARWSEVNAFALPGGQIILLNGLITNASSAEEVAGVFAHEIGHVISRDPTRVALRTGASFGVLSLVLGDMAGGIVAAGVASSLVEARNSRSVETAADDAALRILRDARVPAQPLSEFFERLVTQYGDSESLFASHPLSAGRAAKFAQAPATAPGAEPILTEAEWADLQAICAD